ncbi:MAG: VWA domain-containing protein, partial [Rubrivivax sp.]|nr:VWA domain-containing protein [Pyrinomonadaceae bacterium]
MKRFFFRFTTAIMAFVVGVGAAFALVRNTKTEPPVRPASTEEKTLEMVFVLDTTGSMGGLIEGAKQRIWGIINEVMQTPAHPSVRVGLVAYRDNGDQYVTQTLPLTNDLDKVYTTLMDYRADGGGDTPENVRRALADGVHRAGWSKNSANLAQIVFLVGDAPPHDDYKNEPDTLVTTALAVKAGMIVNTIQCGAADDTRQIWQTIARRGEGQYFAIAQDGGVQTVSTPYDARLSELGNKRGSTYLAYGGGPGA